LERLDTEGPTVTPGTAPATGKHQEKAMALWRQNLLVGTLALAPLVPLSYVDFGALSPERATTHAVHIALWGVIALVAGTVFSRRSFRDAAPAEEAASKADGPEPKPAQPRTFGPYTLEEKIGQGGMGEVYRARHAMLERPTAIKVLPKPAAVEADILRFAREVQLTSQLCHPNTIQIYDYGRADDGTFYYAMEYLDGLTLEDLVRRHGPQSPGRVARICADVCGSLAEAHAAGLVHRDVKPENIMLCARGGQFDVVKVLDFGLVRALTGREAFRSAFPRGMIGTPKYMSPEMILEPGSVDARSDLYALGAVTFYLLTGTPVFNAENTTGILLKHLNEPPGRPSRRSFQKVPESLDRVVEACLSKSPDQRPQTAQELRCALLSIAEAEQNVDLESWWNERESSQRGMPESFAPTRRQVTAAVGLAPW
jgi:serine/threonine protein kinase